MLKNYVYDCLKWLCLIALPAISVLYTVLANVWHLPLAYEICATIDAIAVFIGSLIGLSTYKYNKAQQQQSGYTSSTEVDDDD